MNAQDPKSLFLQVIDAKIQKLQEVKAIIADELAIPENLLLAVSTNGSTNGTSKRAHRPNPFNDYISQKVSEGLTRKQAVRAYRKMKGWGKVTQPRGWKDTSRRPKMQHA